MAIDAKTIWINAKCSDRFQWRIKDESGKTLGEGQETYVPDWFPGNHYGDAVMLEIDLASGLIVNWKAPTKKQIEGTLAESDDFS